MKYTQATTNHNNEFSNMPSIVSYTVTNRICPRNLDKAAIDEIKTICNKHGFKCGLIHSTFGGDDISVVVYYKTNISQNQWDAWKKAKDYDKMRQQTLAFKEKFMELHNCIHELDENSLLYFDCAWSGNCGLFANDDVTHKSYCGASSLKDWSYIENWFSPLIHDTTSVLSKGVYVMVECNYFLMNKQKKQMLN